jgi:N-acetylglucosaminyldiphosphoundecaprenol N-acetyl-beta-D-mannosaminyltransferase
MKKIDLLGIAVNTGTYQEFMHRILDGAASRSSSYACVANVHMLVEAHHDASFASVVQKAGMITPDGKPLAWALRLLHGVRQERVAGMDLLPDLLAGAEQRQLSVFFYGGQETLLETTAQYVKTHYPQLVVSGLYSPPFRALSKEEEEETVRRINSSGAQLVFVVLGCPKQEKWMASMQGRIRAAMIGVGGALPVLIGAQKRAPGWMQHAGLEWVYRLGQEPGRLFKRYAVTNTIFLVLLGKAFVQRRLFGKMRSTNKSFT